MQSTTNYSLNILEGTDLVNPPIQLNPNFQTIDAEMFANKQGTIGTATEVVTGTVHAIVRSNQDSDTFRFTATGAWTAGDTMTLDGSAVTVHLSDGTTPPTGAYIIGAEVLAVVNGSLVTLMIGATPPAQGVTSFNSRTGAVTPQASDYDASMIDYDNTVSGLAATDTQAAIDEIVDDVQNVLSYIDVTNLPANGDFTSYVPAGKAPVVAIIYNVGSLPTGQMFTPLIGKFPNSPGNYYLTILNLSTLTLGSMVSDAVFRIYLK